MRTKVLFRSAVATLAALSIMLVPSAHAVDRCKVKIDKKTGVIGVDATGVTGDLLWGSEQGAETSTFFNSIACLSQGRAKRCGLADPATIEAKTPPAGCTIYLADGGADRCSAWIRGCTPGVRGDVDLTPTQADSLDELLEHVSISFTGNPLSRGLAGAPTVVFSGVNVQIVNGTGSTYSYLEPVQPCTDPFSNTDCPLGTSCVFAESFPTTGEFPPMACAAPNGVGNLIIGYDESSDTSTKAGSHNLIVGPWHSYGEAVGGVVVGASNEITYYSSSVTAGLNNSAGGFASVSGGQFNTASGGASSVSGGLSNEASGTLSSVSGGTSNTATGDPDCVPPVCVPVSHVSGGSNNVARGINASVFAGQNNEATGANSVVLGGNGNATAVDDDIAPDPPF